MEVQNQELLITFSEFLDLDTKLECQSRIVLMDEVICQNDPGFLNLLSNMRNGSVTEQDSKVILSQCLDKLPSNEIRGFDNALQLVQN